jgi:hypothetical protein
LGKARRQVLKPIEEGKFSGEEDDRELPIVLDEWISLLDSLKTKQKAREDRIGKAGQDTAQSKRLQENLGRKWSHKELSPAPQASGSDDQPIDEDLQILSTGPSSATSRSLVRASPSISVPEQTLASTTSSSRPSQKRARQQPLPPQPLVDIAAEMKAEREGVAQATPSEELLRLDAEVKELRESINKRLAQSEEK